MGGEAFLNGAGWGRAAQAAHVYVALVLMAWLLRLIPLCNIAICSTVLGYCLMLRACMQCSIASWVPCLDHWHCVQQMDALGQGWFSELSILWPGQSMSLEVQEVLYQEQSKYQNVLVFKRHVRFMCVEHVISWACTCTPSRA